MPVTKQYSDIINTPVGYLGVQANGETLSGVEFLGKRLSTHARNMRPLYADKSVFIDSVRHALMEYFINPYSIQQPPTLLNGTAFQLKVWKILSSIAPGTTQTYGDIARQLASSARAVGNACRQNPVPIFIPCHRVVASAGRGGFMGQTTGEAIEIKQWLLTYEKNFNKA